MCECVGVWFGVWFGGCVGVCCVVVVFCAFSPPSAGPPSSGPPPPDRALPDRPKFRSFFPLPPEISFFLVFFKAGTI